LQVTALRILALLPSLLRFSALTGALSLSWSCAARSDPAANAAAAEPRISWELRTGDRRGDERLVCRSGGPERCLLDATTDQNRMLALVGLRLHPLDRATNYVGTVQAPFVEGIAGLDEVSVAVGEGGSPVNRTILGRVTRQPGAYTMTFTIDAVVKGSAVPVRIHEEIPVTVR
jgi:hypothetical protein